MNKIMKSTIIKFELNNGEKVDLTLNFSKLLKVRNEKKSEYAKYNKVVMEGIGDIDHQMTILYMAYLCGLQDLDSAMTREEFIELLPPYQLLINTVVRDLTSPKKQMASGKPSKGNSEDQSKK